jgi:hypothetical protein
MTSDDNTTERRMRPTGAVPRPGVGQQRDDATRYLCAAAHVDPAFADLAIREFLIEPLRAIPPTPALDAATVLREAVAARSRRLLRDWLLLAILILFTISGVGIAILWFVFGIVMSMIGAARSDARSQTVKLVWAIGLVAIVVIVVATAPQLVGSLLGSAVAGLSLASLAPGPYTVLLGLAALAVLVLDRFALSYLLTRSFRRGTFVALPTVDTWPGERWVRTFRRTGRRARQLARVADAAGTNLIAYRGFEPFAGAGTRGEAVAMPIPLEPAEPDDDDDDGVPTEPTTFTLTELYEHVTAALLEMRDSPSLAPSGRLAGLTEHELVVTPVAEVLVNFADPATRIVLPSLDRPPLQSVTPDVLADLVEHPLEWLRYFRCFQLETWNRDVTVSMYLHFGASERMLYLEWIPFVLYPIAARYRVSDHLPVEPLGPLRDALVDWLRLPGALLGRIGGLVRRIKPIRTRPGLVLPEKYGTSYGLRELGAGVGANNYFQDADVTRYLQLLTGRMIRAIGQFLEERGIEVTEFMAQAQAVGDQYTFNGPVQATSIGSNNKVTNRRRRRRPRAAGG